MRGETGEIGCPRERTGLRTRVTWRVARSEQRLHDAGIHRVDLTVAVDVILAEVYLVGRTEGRLHQAAVHRIHLTIAVHIAVTYPLRIAQAAAFACVGPTVVVLVRAVRIL